VSGRTTTGGSDEMLDATPHRVPSGKIAFDPTLFQWAGIEAHAYKFALGDMRGMGWRGVSRFTIGGPPAVPAQFELRYFELAPGGYSSIEKHQHIHLIIVLRGRGKALIGAEVVDLAPYDLAYVPPATPHRWINDSEEPFGFLCPVNAPRDAPQPLSDEEWIALERNPVTAPYVY
jgi:S-methyl-1-thioxylulose 5-phosphate methylthiotransferase